MKPLRDNLTEPKTQKAKGIRALEKSGHLRNVTNAHYLVQTKDDVARVRRYGAENYSLVLRDTAIRPCPPRARHGYFETERVSYEHFFPKLTEKFDQVKRDHEDAELLVAPWVEAVSSGILTANSITIGPGHDGATGGKDAQVIKLASIEENEQAGQCWYDRTTAGIHPDEGTYIEFVRRNDNNVNVVLTQLRGGPPSCGSADYIPESTDGMKVTRVVEFSEEQYTLLEWEQATANFPRGTVVYHPGGAVACHAGVHCVLNGIPYITTLKPVLGSKLHATQANEYTNEDLLLQGIRNGMYRYKARHAPHMVHTALFALHNYGADRGEISSFLVGLGVAYTWKLIASACLGELRHGFKHITASPRGAVESLFSVEADYKSRESYYREALVMQDDLLENMLVDATKSYAYDYWGAGYGGIAWAQCALSALALRDNMLLTLNNPTRRRIRLLISAFNRAINTAHNNGSPLQKFSGCLYGNDCMTYAAFMNRAWLLKDAAAAICDAVVVDMKRKDIVLEPLTSSWRGKLDRRDMKVISTGARNQWRTERHWQAVAVESVARAVSGSKLEHKRCRCTNCSPHLHKTLCVGQCATDVSPAKPYCTTKCDVRRARTGGDISQCPCTVCVEAQLKAGQEVCLCVGDECCKACCCHSCYADDDDEPDDVEDGE